MKKIKMMITLIMCLISTVSFSQNNILIYDLTGKLCAISKSPSDNIEAVVIYYDLKNGMYIIKIEDNNLNIIETFKINIIDNKIIKKSPVIIID
jgi:hypothetical protein